MTQVKIDKFSRYVVVSERILGNYTKDNRIDTHWCILNIVRIASVSYELLSLDCSKINKVSHN